MRAVVRFIDTLLRKCLGIYEFSCDPDCILRIQLTRSAHSVSFVGERILRHAPIVAIHAWNERIPAIPPTGPDFQWALCIRHQIIHSFTELAKVMKTETLYAEVQAVCGTSALFSITEHTGGTRMIQHMGFTVLPSFRPLGKFGEFWENLFAWGMMWAYNSASLKSREFRRMQRTEIWITAAEFIRRYGEPS